MHNDDDGVFFSYLGNSKYRMSKVAENLAENEKKYIKRTRKQFFAAYAQATGCRNHHIITYCTSDGTE